MFIQKLRGFWIIFFMLFIAEEKIKLVLLWYNLWFGCFYVERERLKWSETTVFLKVNYLNVQFSTFSIVNKFFIIISYANYWPHFFILAFFNFFILSTGLHYYVTVSNISFLFFFQFLTWNHACWSSRSKSCTTNTIRRTRIYTPEKISTNNQFTINRAGWQPSGDQITTHL